MNCAHEIRKLTPAGETCLDCGARFYKPNFSEALAWAWNGEHNSVRGTVKTTEDYEDMLSLDDLTWLHDLRVYPGRGRPKP